MLACRTGSDKPDSASTRLFVPRARGGEQRHAVHLRIRLSQVEYLLGQRWVAAQAAEKTLQAEAMALVQQHKSLGIAQPVSPQQGRVEPAGVLPALELLGEGRQRRSEAQVLAGLDDGRHALPRLSSTAAADAWSGAWASGGSG